MLFSFFDCQSVIDGAVNTENCEAFIITFHHYKPCILSFYQISIVFTVYCVSTIGNIDK